MHKCYIELSTILLESIMIAYSKTFIKTEDLANFNKIKKYNKIWNHNTQ